MRRFLPLLALALGACALPITIGLPDQTLDIPSLLHTGDLVLYPKDPLTFNRPPVDVVQSVEVRGRAVANQPLNATLEVYGRVQSPPCGLDPSGSFYLCPKDQEERLGELAFNGTSQTSFTLQGQALTQGVKEGRLWLGVGVQGLPAGGVRLELKDMQATLRTGF